MRASACASSRPDGLPRAGEVRQALRQVIGAGLSGPAETLAALTGWPPERVRHALQKMRRAGELSARDLDASALPGPRPRGRPPKVYGAPVAPMSGPAQTLAFVQSVWR